jgi:nucleoid DNA-binding protein
MNKKTLLNKVKYNTLIKNDSIEKVFDRMFEIIRENVKENRYFEIEEFGKFEILHKHIAKEYDAKKQSDVLVPPKDKILFTPSGTLLEKLNSGNE